MENQFGKSQNRTLASKIFDEVLLDFLLSRQAMMCTERTIEWYRFTLERIITWLIDHGVKEPNEISSRHMRTFLGELAGRGYADSYMHTFARAMKTFSRFMLAEGYISETIKFPMPKIADKRLLVYTANQIKQILIACKNNRDSALILLMVDTGLRDAEVRALDWGNVDLSSGVIRVIRGKGRKTRVAIVGINTRRALLKYRNQVNGEDSKPVFQTISGNRFTKSGLRSWMMRLSNRANIHITSHALRRTFATLSLKAGMDVFQLQALMGHASLEMTRHYVRLVDEDLMTSHKAHGPIDNLIKI